MCVYEICKPRHSEYMCPNVFGVVGTAHLQYAKETNTLIICCFPWRLTSANLDSSSKLRSSTCRSEFLVCSYILWACSALCLSFSSFISRVVIRLAAETISLFTSALSALSMLLSLPDIKEKYNLGWEFDMKLGKAKFVSLVSWFLVTHWL